MLAIPSITPMANINVPRYPTSVYDRVLSYPGEGIGLNNGPLERFWLEDKIIAKPPTTRIAAARIVIHRGLLASFNNTIYADIVIIFYYLSSEMIEKLTRVFMFIPFLITSFRVLSQYF